MMAASDAKRPKNWAWLAVGLSTCLVLMACGGSDPNPTTAAQEVAEVATTATTTAQQEPTATLAEDEPESDFPKRTYYGESDNEDGSTFSTTIRFGSMTKASESENLPTQFQGLTSVCEVDPERDVFFPVSVEVENTNAGSFSQSIPSGLNAGGFDFDAYGDLHVELAMGFGDGPACKSPGGGGNYTMGSVVFKDVEPGETRTIDSLAVVRNYFSPEYPDGSEPALSKLTLGPLQSLSSLTCFDGPGARNGSFTLDGSQQGPGGRRIPKCAGASERPK